MQNEYESIFSEIASLSGSIGNLCSMSSYREPDEIEVQAQALKERYLDDFTFGINADLLDDLMIQSLISFASDTSERKNDRKSCLEQAETLLEPYRNHRKSTSKSRRQAEPSLQMH